MSDERKSRVHSVRPFLQTMTNVTVVLTIDDEEKERVMVDGSWNDQQSSQLVANWVKKYEIPEKEVAVLTSIVNSAWQSLGMPFMSRFVSEVRDVKPDPRRFRFRRPTPDELRRREFLVTLKQVIVLEEFPLDDSATDEMVQAMVRAWAVRNNIPGEQIPALVQSIIAERDKRRAQGGG